MRSIVATSRRYPLSNGASKGAFAGADAAPLPHSSLDLARDAQRVGFGCRAEVGESAAQQPHQPRPPPRTGHLDNPSTGALVLADGTLTVSEISRQDLRHGELTFLSACKSATGGTILIDETITLAAALHFAGYRHVVGTLWTIGDTTAADLVELVYPQLAPMG